jgi:methyltransferase OMS1
LAVSVCCQGDTLEVSAGTGRNLKYYNYQNLSSLTLTDSSVNMLEEAYEKTLLGPNKDTPVTVCQSNVENLGKCASIAAGAAGEAVPRAGCRIQPCSAEVKARKYDTVVDTFGLCSHKDPIEALMQMQRACKPGGRIILIEHGRSYWDWVNEALDGSAEKHYSNWGCWWNRDIGRIVKEAGLTVESEQRWHFGTTYIIVATA